MEYIYNDVLLCDTNFGKIIAKYMCYRPDKDLIIVDFNNRLHQLDFMQVELATEEDIRNRFEPIMLKCDVSITHYKNNIVEFKKQLKEYETSKSHVKEKLDKKREELDSLVVMKEMLTTQNAKNVGDILSKIDEVKDDTEHFLEILRGLQNQCDRRIDAMNSWKSDIKTANINKKEAETEMNNLLEVLYANRKRVEKISKTSV